MIFALILMSVTGLTGLIYLLDVIYFAKKRAHGKKESIIIEYSKSFFPVLLFVFVIRSFIVEPFKIPSGSMMPTLIAGDFIAVNKFSDSFIIAETPKASNVVCIKQPEIKPKTVARPYFLPFTMLCVKTKILSGPGDIAKIEVANAKDKIISIIF